MPVMLNRLVFLISDAANIINLRHLFVCFLFCCLSVMLSELDFTAKYCRNLQKKIFRTIKHQYIPARPKQPADQHCLKPRPIWSDQWWHKDNCTKHAELRRVILCQFNKWLQLDHLKNLMKFAGNGAQISKQKHAKFYLDIFNSFWDNGLRLGPGKARF